VTETAQSALSQIVRYYLRGFPEIPQQRESPILSSLLADVYLGTALVIWTSDGFALVVSNGAEKIPWREIR
jgi:hypothetical protein